MTKLRLAIDRIFNQIALLSPKWAILIILILSVSVKLCYIEVLGGGLYAFPLEGSDSSAYDVAARVILSSGTFGVIPHVPTTGFPPGETFFLVLLYSISGYSMALTKLAHIALLCAAALLTYFTGRNVAQPVVGFWAGVLIAIDPAQAYLAGTFLSEPLFIFLTMLAIYILSKPNLATRSGWLILVGICFGLAGLTRNEGWLFAIALWLGAWVTWDRLIPRRAATIVLAVTCLAIAPWTIRNYIRSGRFVPVSSNGGLTLWSANNPEFVWRQPMPMSLSIYNSPTGLSDTQRDQYFRQRAIDWITMHPLDFAVNGVRKVIVLYSFDPLSAQPKLAPLYRLAGLFPYGILLPFIALGLVCNLRNTKFRIILWYILFTTSLAIIFFGDSRVRTSIQPYLYIFGILGVQVFWRWLQALGLRRTAKVSLDRG